MTTVRDDNVSEMSVSMVMIAFDSAGPAAYLAELRQDAEPERLGEETIDGVPTTHFRAAVD